MKITTLGKVEQVGLRKIWKHEALDFTNWLAETEALANTIGIDMQVSSLRENACRLADFGNEVNYFRRYLI